MADEMVQSKELIGPKVATKNKNQLQQEKGGRELIRTLF
jgi:hypothetical protein